MHGKESSIYLEPKTIVPVKRYNVQMCTALFYVENANSKD